jgi:hypothetical protein
MNSLVLSLKALTLAALSGCLLLTTWSDGTMLGLGVVLVAGIALSGRRVA